VAWQPVRDHAAPQQEHHVGQRPGGDDDAQRRDRRGEVEYGERQRDRRHGVAGDGRETACEKPAESRMRQRRE
jgi:hypothetical protein